MTQVLPPLTQDRLDALVASAILWLTWLLGVVYMLGAPSRSRRLLRFVKRWERRVECITYLRARQLMPAWSRKPGYPLKAAPGFRRQAGDKRLLMKCARIRARGGATPQQRITRLFTALAQPERFIARFHKRFARGLHGFRPFAAQPPAAACASLAAPPLAFSDSS